MYQGQRIETFVQNAENIPIQDKQRFFQIILDIHTSQYKANIFNLLEESFDVNRSFYNEEFEHNSYSANRFVRVNYVGSVNKSNDLTRDDIQHFLINNGITTNVYISDITDQLIMATFPFWKTSIKTGSHDSLSPITTNKYLTRMINDIIVENGSGRSVFKYFSRWCFSNGFYSLGKKYYKKCEELGLLKNITKITDEKNKQIIKAIFKADYSCLIEDIVRHPSLPIFKFIVKDHFFLYHPSYDNRRDVHNFLIADVANIFYRNCPLMRDIICGFMEYVFYYNDELYTDENYQVSPNRECIHFLAFEFDYKKQKSSAFDFENPNWRPITKQKQLDLDKLKKDSFSGSISRQELCKGVNRLRQYKIQLSKEDYTPVPWNQKKASKDIVEFDYIDWSVHNKNVMSLLDIKAWSQIKKFEFRSKINKFFLDYFDTEHMTPPLNNDIINKVKIDYQDNCTFFIYDKSLINANFFQQ